MDVSNRRMAKGENTRVAILDRARIMASLRGLEGLTIGDLAAELGMSKSGLYVHFGSKQALQLAVVERLFEAFRREVIELALAQPDGTDQVAALLDRWIDWSCAAGHPGGCPLLGAIVDVDAVEGPVRDRLAEGWAIWRRVVRAAAGRAGLTDPDSVAGQVFGLYLDQHLQHWLMGDTAAPDAARRALSGLLEARRA